MLFPGGIIFFSDYFFRGKRIFQHDGKEGCYGGLFRNGRCHVQTGRCAGPQAAGSEKKPAVVTTARPPEQPCRAQPERQHAPVQAADRRPAQEEKRKAEPAQKQDPARKAAAEGKGEETAVQSLAAELSTLEAYTPLQILVDDCTPEKLSGTRAAQIIELNPHAPDFTAG